MLITHYIPFPIVEHNREGVLALEHSIIGKEKSIICMSLAVMLKLRPPASVVGKSPTRNRKSSCSGLIVNTIFCCYSCIYKLYHQSISQLLLFLIPVSFLELAMTYVCRTLCNNPPFNIRDKAYKMQQDHKNKVKFDTSCRILDK